MEFNGKSLENQICDVNDFSLMSCLFCEAIRLPMAFRWWKEFPDFLPLRKRKTLTWTSTECGRCSAIFLRLTRLLWTKWGMNSTALFRRTPMINIPLMGISLMAVLPINCNAVFLFVSITSRSMWRHFLFKAMVLKWCQFRRKLSPFSSFTVEINHFSSLENDLSYIQGK